MSQLMFVLDVEEGWPPVAKECMPCSELGFGYRIEVPPLFIKGLSVGDVISVTRNVDGDVEDWSHIEKSLRSTVWIMVTGNYSIDRAIECLKHLNCNVEEFEPYRYFSIDVPEDCSLDLLDACLEDLDDEYAAVAFSSLRHQEES